MLRAMSVWLPCSEVCQRNYRPRKFVTVSCWSVCGCVLLSEAWRHVCRPIHCLLLRRQRSSVVCQLSTVCVYSCITSIPSTFSWYYDRRAGRATPVLCPASVSDLYIARSLPGQRVHVMSVSERLLTEWIALEHGVNLLHQWRHRTSLQSLLFEITLNTWTFIVAM